MNFILLICLSICYLNNFYVNSATLKQESKENVSNICFTQDCIETAALITTSIDDTIDPCDDFYKYACGNWQEEHFVPTNASYSYSHPKRLNNKNQDRLFYKLNKGYQPDQPAVLKRLYNFYNSCIDLESRNKVGLKDIKEFIHSIGGWHMIDSNWDPENYHWEDAYAIVRQVVYNSFPFILEITQDLKNSSQNVLQFSSPYSTIKSHEIKINGIFKQDDPIEIMPKFGTLDFYPWQNFTQDIKGSPLNYTEWDRVTRDLNTFSMRVKNISSNITYNGTMQEYILEHYDDVMWSVDKLREATPNINWDKIFMRLFGTTNITAKVIVIDTYFAHQINDLIKQVDKRTLAHEYALDIVISLVPFTTQKMQERFGIFLPIKKLCIKYASQLLPDLVSKLYLDYVNFDINTRTNIQNMVESIKTSFHQLLEANNWLDPVTKKIAKEKLTAIYPNVAASDVVFDEKSLEQDSAEYGDLKETFFFNVVKAFYIKNKKALNILGHPQNKSRWPFGLGSADVVNAFYHPLYNQIYLPAGIAQLPFYGLNIPISANLGALGVIIGHELTHGFDDQGSKYDLHGQYKKWWTNETLQKFNTKNECFVKQYSRFNVTEANEFVNGKQTLGENIADNGGMREAFNALQNYKKLGRSIDKLPSDLAHLSDEKIFFLSYANGWCENKDRETAKSGLLNDVHSPAHARVVLPLANFDEFAKTYNCPVNTRMNPKDKCITW